jgi:methylenetetrahydrofolate reductase (NADPH)
LGRAWPELISFVGYPDGHPDHLLNEEQELSYLKEKIDAGGEYIVTQLFYDASSFVEWVRKVRAKGMLIR